MGLRRPRLSVQFPDGIPEERKRRLDWADDIPSGPFFTVNLTIDSPMEIRSVDTCIGLGEFSKILDTTEVESAKSQIPPPPINVKVDLVSTTPARMRWKPPTVAEFLSYVINYWKIGSISLSAKKETTRCGCTSYQLEGLESETTYQLNICTIADDGWRNKSSGNFEFTTTETFRFAETFVRRCQKIGRYDGLDLHQIPLSKVTADRLSTAADLFLFGWRFRFQ